MQQNFVLKKIHFDQRKSVCSPCTQVIVHHSVDQDYSQELGLKAKANKYGLKAQAKAKDYNVIDFDTHKVTQTHIVQWCIIH